jgi:hypothetical protein
MSSSVTHLPAEVQVAFHAAVDARRRFHSASNGNRRREAINDLAAANRVLAAHNPGLVDGAAQSAKLGGSR